jgi:hypothetical protein
VVVPNDMMSHSSFEEKVGGNNLELKYQNQ